MFITSDIYTVNSTGLKLMHCWTEKVTKFDSSAFYNWEQDNMPVYDLEERTHYLWEKLGFPTSSIPGLSLVVSADASDQAISCNGNIFRTVSAAIAALPEMIHFPILIEIANFGQLGDLVLNNFKFGPKGSLEIINRNFANADADASATLVLYGLPIAGKFSIHKGRGFGGTNPYNYVSGINTNYPLFVLPDVDLQYIFDPKIHFREASCLSISTTVCSGTGTLEDVRLSSTLNGIVAVAQATESTWDPGVTIYTYANQYSKSNLILASNNNVSLYNDGSGNNYTDWLTFKSYDLNSNAADKITQYDVSTIDYLNSNTHLYLNDGGWSHLYNGLFYGNNTSKIIINNCDGPIFIRNFFVDGSGLYAKNNNYGVEVNNSPKVYLENVVSTRHRKAGFIFNNSNINLLRNCVATRNYGFDSSDERITGSWLAKSLYDSFSNSNYLTNKDNAAGLIANNSTVTVSSVREFQEVIQRQHIAEKTSTNTYPVTDYTPFINKNCIFEFSKNSNGIILNNSTFKGGEICVSPIETNKSLNTTYINIYNNTECGLKSNNSVISFDGKLSFFENLFGAVLDNSTFEIDKATFLYNQKVGLLANNSNISYNKNLMSYAALYSLEDVYFRGSRPVHFDRNGQHLILNFSKFVPTMASGMDSLYNSVFTNNPLGVKDLTSRSILPGIELNNSKAIFVSPVFIREYNYSVVSGSNTGCKGSELSLRNNSNATLIGTKNWCSRIQGPNSRPYHKNIAAIYAGDNSTVEINGPTVMLQYGINLLAENGSNIKMNPQRLDGENSIDVSSFNLNDPLNHTAVELHSTRACVVVDNNSTFTARDLGSYYQNWNFTGTYLQDLLSSGLDMLSVSSISPYVSAGSLQFYPNPITPEGINNYDITGLTFPGVEGIGYSVYNSNKFTLGSDSRSLYYFRDRNTAFYDYSAITFGGMCVRALNNSLVNVHNVNFPCGWWVASGPYYDNTVPLSSGGLCYRTFIWNIADTSQLKASYLSVSGLHPTSATYFGPSGVWRQSNGSAASGLPAGTPDTGSLSVLDYFGHVSRTINPYAPLEAENRGPFRLYFSISPAAHILTDVSSNTFAITPQIYSQGYQPSSNLMCSDTGLSSLNKVILNKTGTTVYASGYYYGNTMTDPYGYTRVLLDESAANVFANSKHCSVGKSNNSKLVSIYYPYTTVQFGSSYTRTGVKSPNTFDLLRDN